MSIGECLLDSDYQQWTADGNDNCWDFINLSIEIKLSPVFIQHITIIVIGSPRVKLYGVGG